MNESEIPGNDSSSFMATTHKDLPTRVPSLVRFVTQTSRFVTMLLRYLLMQPALSHRG